MLDRIYPDKGRTMQAYMLENKSAIFRPKDSGLNLIKANQWSEISPAAEQIKITAIIKAKTRKR